MKGDNLASHSVKFGMNYLALPYEARCTTSGMFHLSKAGCNGHVSAHGYYNILRCRSCFYNFERMRRKHRTLVSRDKMFSRSNISFAVCYVGRTVANTCSQHPAKSIESNCLSIQYTQLYYHPPDARNKSINEEYGQSMACFVISVVSVVGFL